MQGGFIWDWVDQGLLHKVKDASGKTVEAWGYGGDFGDPVHDAQFNINGLIWPNREPHPGCWECKAVMVRLTKGILADYCWHAFVCPPTMGALRCQMLQVHAEHNLICGLVLHRRLWCSS